MTDGDALLAAVLADPDADLPRLVYADWLDEQGDHDRAEFIRLGVRFARIAADDPDAVTTIDRLIELQDDAHIFEWSEPIWPRFLESCAPFFERGFVKQVMVHRAFTPQMAAALGELLARHPVEKLYLPVPSDFRWLLADLASWPQTGTLRELLISGERVRDQSYANLHPEAVVALGRCPHLPNLRRLSLGGLISAATLTDYARGPAAGRLTWFSCSPPWLPTSADTAEWLDALMRAPFFRQLEGLHVSLAGLGDDLFARLLAALPAGRLTELAVSRCRLNDDAVRRLLRWDGLPQLRHLDLSNNYFRSRTLADLLRAVPLDGLTTLNLSECLRADDHARDALAAMATGRFVGRLEELYLRNNRLTPSAIRPLTEGRLPALRTLDLDDNPLGDSGVELLVRSDLMRTVRRLSLNRCGVTDRGALALAAADSHRLPWLSLRDSLIGPDGFRALRERFGDRADLTPWGRSDAGPGET